MQRFQTNQRMSQAIVHNGTVYLSGQVPNDITANFEVQVHQVLEKISHQLSGVKSDKARLLSAVIYLKDMSYFSSFNDIWETWLPEGAAPTRTAVKADLAREDVLVEITVTAAV